MKIHAGVFLCLWAASLEMATPFVAPSSRTKRSAFALRATEDYGNLLKKLASPPPAVVASPPPAVEAVTSTTAASDVVLPTEISVPTSELSIPDVSLPDISLGGDFPIVPIAIGVIAVLAGVALLSGGGGGGKVEPTTAPTKAVSAPSTIDVSTTTTTAVSAPSTIDVSIPYDAAARLAYDKSDKSMAYDDFKTKYEADAVAQVKAKQNVSTSTTPAVSAPSTIDLSIPYDAAARLAYDKSDKSMAYDDFKTKYEADAVAQVKAKQKK